MTAPHYLLLGRPDCHLCEEFEAALREHLQGRDYVLETADVDARAEWRLRYGRRIPVLLDAQGEVRAEGHFDPEAWDRGAG